MARQRSGLVSAVIFVQLISVFGSSCNWQYFQHYEQKRCNAVLGENGCPVRFQCEELSQKDFKSCIHDGKIYKDGDDITGLGPCNSCYCNVFQGSTYIECASVYCPSLEPHNQTCYIGYKPTECCPVEICPNEKSIRKICNYEGKKYEIGEIIETSNPCKTCICTEKWTNEDGPGCSTVNCPTGIYAQQIRRGCLPIYSEDSCCITEMYCDNIYGSTPEILLTGSKHKENYCHYRGKNYRRGSSIFLDTDLHHCISCKCTSPPDFTCLRKSCQSQPRDDCKAVRGHCCPDYECP